MRDAARDAFRRPKAPLLKPAAPPEPPASAASLPLMMDCQSRFVSAMAAFILASTVFFSTCALLRPMSC